jgi:hypothetical protein
MINMLNIVKQEQEQINKAEYIEYRSEMFSNDVLFLYYENKNKVYLSMINVSVSIVSFVLKFLIYIH